MKDNRKILVTGSRGFVGRHLCKRLEADGMSVQTTDINLSKAHKLPYQYSPVDITQMERLHCIEKDIDIVVHLAAKTSVPISCIKPHETYFVNIVGTLNLLEWARQKNVSNFIYVSTYVYGQPKYLPVDETHQVNPHSPYQRSKLIAEQLCRNYYSDFGINVVTLRPFYIYGPNSRPEYFIPSILNQIVESGTVLLSGKQTSRDFLFVNDFVDLVETILTNFPKGYNVYNVGYGKGSTLEQVSEILGRILDKDIRIKYDEEMRRGDVTNMVADISKVSKDFNWYPNIDLEMGLRLTVDTL